MSSKTFLNLSLIYLLANISSLAIARTLPALNGHINNYSHYKTNEVKVSVRYDCFSRDFMGWRQPCGSDSVAVNADANGDFSIRELNTNSGFLYEYDLTVIVTLPDTKRYVSASFSMSEQSEKNYGPLKNLSVF